MGIISSVRWEHVFSYFFLHVPWEPLTCVNSLRRVRVSVSSVARFVIDCHVFLTEKYFGVRIMLLFRCPRVLSAWSSKYENSDRLFISGLVKWFDVLVTTSRVRIRVTWCLSELTEWLRRLDASVSSEEGRVNSINFEK